MATAASSLIASLDWVADVPWEDVFVPITAAAIGAVTAISVARHLRREDLYVRAAEKVNEYIDEASLVLNGIDRNGMFDPEAIGRAHRSVNLARFHSLRLESAEVTNRLAVTDFLLRDIALDQSYAGLFWAFESINDVMAAVVEFMKLPRGIWFRQTARRLPAHRFPNTTDQYTNLVQFNAVQQLDFNPLRTWTHDRMAELGVSGPRQP